ncbi:MAG: diacylglycerol kinase [Pseudomonadales bacterium]|jgi:diacylglycerol kinase (ATP)|nr:diacylglycerol kinase [Pseudomonadales bacterium]
MAGQNLTGIARLKAAYFNSWAGLIAAWKNEEAFRIESCILLLALPLGLWLGENAVERGLLIGSLMLLLIVELLNSSVESTVDRIGPERHELSGRAKDIASAAVFITMCLAGLVWALIAYERYPLF